MEIWNIIVKSNTFNFLILLGFIILLCKIFKAGSLIEGACQKIKTNIENSDNAKSDSEKKLDEARKAVENVANEVKEIFDNAQKNAGLIGDKILKEADNQAKRIFENANKVLEQEGKKLVLSLTQKTALASLETAKNHIQKTLEEKPDYHMDFIKQSIDELNRLKTDE